MNITHCPYLGSAAAADIHRETVLEASNWHAGAGSAGPESGDTG